MYKSGNIFDDDLILVEDNIFDFNWYCVNILSLLLLLSILFLLFNNIILCFWFKKCVDNFLFLYISLWYVIRILVFDIFGVVKIFLYFFNILYIVMFKLNFFNILLIINICGFCGL